MTEWIGTVHEAVKKSGAERELAVRVPASIEGCLSVGLDPVEWASQGLVDAIVAEPLTHVDPAADFRPLVEAARGSDCRILAGLTDNVESDRQGRASIEVVRAAACNYWAQGVDGIYLMAWYTSWPYDSRFYEKVREVPYPEVMGPKDKYYVLPNKAPRPGAHPGAVTQLPAELEVDVPVKLRIPVSDDLARWDAAGRVHEVILRVRVAANTEVDRLSFKFNGRELPQAGLRKINEIYRMKSLRQSGGAGSGYWYVFRLEREDWPVNGGNTLEVTLLERDPDVLPKAGVHFAELETRYLMGKNFHRGFVDPDLGPYEHTSM